MRFVLVVLGAWILVGSVLAVTLGRTMRVLGHIQDEPMTAPAARHDVGGHEGPRAELTAGADVIRVLIDEIQLLRAEMVDARSTA